MAGSHGVTACQCIVQSGLARVGKTDESKPFQGGLRVLQPAAAG